MSVVILVYTHPRSFSDIHPRNAALYAVHPCCTVTWVYNVTFLGCVRFKLRGSVLGVYTLKSISQKKKKP